MKARNWLAAAGLAALISTGGPALAHHSFAMFDATRTIVLDGTVKEFQWTNPHAWIQLVVTDADGKSVEWSIEGASPNALTRAGWSRSIMKPGDKASLTVHPLKDGTSGGALVSAVVNGQPVAPHE